MSTALLFYVLRDDGTVTGPHPVGKLRREYDAGEITLDTRLCLHETEDWLPLHEWQAEILPPAPVSAVTAAYQAHPALSQGTKSPIRIFWAYLSIAAGLIIGLGGLFAGFTNATELLWSVIVIGIGMLWGIAGVAELLRQSKKL